MTVQEVYDSWMDSIRRNDKNFDFFVCDVLDYWFDLYDDKHINRGRLKSLCILMAFFKDYYDGREIDSLFLSTDIDGKNVMH